MLLADALGRAGRVGEALAAARTAVRLDAGSATARCKLAELCLAAKDYDEAEQAARRAIELEAGSAVAHNLLGAALFEEGKFDEALEVARQTTRLPDAPAAAFNNLGLALMALGEFATAAETFQRAVELDAAIAESFYNLANAYRKLAEFDRALASYDRALELAPNHADAHINRASVLLARGDFARGWGEAEWRFAGASYPRFEPPWPIWRGEPLAGRTLVLVAEQGMGDTMQFIRYAPRFVRWGPACWCCARRCCTRFWRGRQASTAGCCRAKSCRRRIIACHC